ncbi:MAG: PIN domain-containing protein [Acidobacteriota bacterium]|nr:PIN domain-containing protein [Acidobacteriota bacterium]
MIAFDSNLLVYAHRNEDPVHDAALAVIGSYADGDEPWAIPWPCCCEFLSVVTNRRIWGERATPMPEAWRQLEEWASAPSVRLIAETEEFLPIFARMAAHPRITGGRVHDARIAAICIANGVSELLTRDRDFAHFPELCTRDPLIAA